MTRQAREAGIAPNGEDRARIIATYVYRDEDGEPLYRVHRWEPKGFSQERHDAGAWRAGKGCMDGVRRVLYRLDEILAESGTLYVVEGEKDADRLWSLGFPATTCAGGAGKWSTEYSADLADRHIVIIPDGDPPGIEHARQVGASIARLSQFDEVHVAELTGAKDISEWLDQGHDISELQPVRFDQWKPAAAAAGQQAAGPTMLHFKTFISGCVAPDYLIDGIIQRKRLYSLTAPTGHGKTSVSMAIAAHQATGRSLLDIRVEQSPAVYFAAENPSDIIARMTLLEAKMQLNGATPLNFIPDTFDLNQCLDGIARQVSEIGGAGSIWIDTSPAFLLANGVTEENDNLAMLGFARELRKLTDLPGSPAVIALVHPTKRADKDNLLPRGGGSYLAEVDGNLTLWAEGDREITELHWQGKLRGPDFDPLPFVIEKATCPGLVDAKGRPINSVWSWPMDRATAAATAAREDSDENAVLLALDRMPDGNLEAWAVHLGWLSMTRPGEGKRYKVLRVLKRLRSDGLVVQKRRLWWLTKAGKDEVARLKKGGLEGCNKPATPEHRLLQAKGGCNNCNKLQQTIKLPRYIKGLRIVAVFPDTATLGEKETEMTPRAELRLLLEDADDLVAGLALCLLDRPELIERLETGQGRLADLLLQREVASEQRQILAATLELCHGAIRH